MTISTGTDTTTKVPTITSAKYPIPIMRSWTEISKSDTSKSTADEASYSTTAVAEVTTTTNDQTTTGKTEPTVPTTVKPKTNSNSESSKPTQINASQTSDHKPAEQSSASGNSSSAQSHSSSQTSAPNQSQSGGQSSSSSQTSNKEPSVSDPNEGKTWHNAVYKTINHPAETKEVKVVDQEAYSYDEPIYGWRTFCNVCGADITETCQSHMKEHALAGEGGRYHDEYVQVDSKTISVPEKSHTETVVVKEAWTEKILVKESGWY